MNNKEILRELLIKHSLKEGYFLLSNDGASNKYVDCKKVSLSAKGSYLIGEAMWLRCPMGTEAVAGLTLGADPLVMAVVMTSYSNLSGVDGLIVRKEAKGHGTKSYIEGPDLEEGAYITVLEDVVTSGKSAMKAVERLREAGYKVDTVVTIIDREVGGCEYLANQGVELRSLYKLEDLI